MGRPFEGFMPGASRVSSTPPQRTGSSHVRGTLQRNFFAVQIACIVLGGFISIVWGGPPEWGISLLWALSLVPVWLSIARAPAAIVSCHSLVQMLLLWWWLGQPAGMASTWGAGLLAPAFVAALPAFWLGVFGGWAGAAAGTVFAVSALCDTPGERLAAVFGVGLSAAVGQSYGSIHRNLLRARRRLRVEALTEPATGLGNLRALERDFPRLRAQAARAGVPLLLTMWDLDGLKLVNDTWGHAAGDALLSSFAETFAKTSRAADGLYRIGGDEFAGLHLGLHDGSLLSARLRQRFSMVSVGWARDEGEELVSLRHRADRELYKDKHRRRERRADRAGLAAFVERVLPL